MSVSGDTATTAEPFQDEPFQDEPFQDEPAEDEPAEADASPVNGPIAWSRPRDRDDHERYAFGDVFAVGGIGVVRRAHDRRLGRVIAVKQLVRHSDVAKRRFALEATITARLQHPAIVPLYDLGWSSSGEPFYCMKLVDGETLDTKIRATTNISDRLRLLEHVIAVADAVAYAHEQQIIHRDIKPANVLVGRFGETIVIDWGLAKDLSEQVQFETSHTDMTTPAHLTAAGAVVGTLHYMAPEQARGGDVDVRSDIYSLGAMLYHVLAGQPPFASTIGPAAVRRVMEGEPTELRSIDPQVPRELAAVAHRALARSPADRYGSAADLAADLRRFQTGRFVSAHEYSLSEMLRLWARRHRPILVVAALALASLAVTITIAFLRIQRERDAANEAREETRQSLLRADEAEVERSEQLYASLLVQARANQQTIERGQRYASLAALEQAIRLAEERGMLAEQRPVLRNLAIASLARIDVQRINRWRVDAFGTPAFDGHLEHVAVPLPRGEFSVRRTADDVEIHRIPSPNYDTWYMSARYYAGDGLLHLEYADRNVPAYWHVFDIRGSAPIEQIHLRNVFAAEADDGRIAWHVGDDGRLVALDVASGRVERRLETSLDPQHVHHLLVHPDGRYLAAADGSREAVDFVDLEADAIVSTMAIGREAWAWGEADMFAVGEVGRVSLWDPLTDREHGELTGYDEKVVGVAFHPGRRTLGTCSWDGTSRFWNVSTKREVLRLEGCFLRFAADGRRIAVQQQTELELWDFAGDDVLRSLPSWARSVTFSADARYLVVAGDRGAELWDIAAFRRIRRLVDGRCLTAVFHPQGNSLLTHCEVDGVSSWPLVLDEQGLSVGDPRSVKPPEPLNLGSAPLVFATEDPSFFAVGSGETGDVWLFDATTLNELGRLQGLHSVRTLAISPNGRWIAASDWKTSSVLVWDRYTSAPPNVLPGSRDGWTFLAFDPRGDYLVLNTIDDTSQWSVGTWQKQRSVPREAKSNYPVSVDPTGNWLAVGGESHVVHLLRMSDLARVAELPMPTRELWELRFSPDGRILAATGAEDGVYLWDIEKLRHELGAMDLDWEL